MSCRLFLLIYSFLSIFSPLKSIDIEDMDRDVYFSDFLYSMTSGEFYNKYRIPLVFYRQSERDLEYSEYMRTGGLTLVTLKQKEKEEETYFKSKCIYPELAILREISNAYISRSHLRWDNCSNLQKKSKQFEMSGQKSFIPELVKMEKESWKQSVVDGLESIIPLPTPQILPGVMAPGVSQHAREYLEILLSITVTNAYLQSNLHLFTEDSAYPKISWANSEISDFNELFYGSNLSSLNIKNLHPE